MCWLACSIIEQKSLVYNVRWLKFVFSLYRGSYYLNISGCIWLWLQITEFFHDHLIWLLFYWLLFTCKMSENSEKCPKITIPQSQLDFFILLVLFNSSKPPNIQFVRKTEQMSEAATSKVLYCFFCFFCLNDQKTKKAIFYRSINFSRKMPIICLFQLLKYSRLFFVFI